MRILFISHYSSIYGANRSMINLITALRDMYGIQSSVLLPENGEVTKILDDINIEYKIAKYWSWVEHSNHVTVPLGIKKAIRNLITSCQLGQYIKKHQIIYSNSSLVSIGYIFSVLYRRKHVRHIREFVDLDYDLKFDFGKDFTLKILRRSDHVIFISKAIRNHFHANQWKNSSQVYNGVMSSKDKRLNFTPQNNPEFTFIIVGLVNKNKGQEQAIMAFKSVHEKYKKTRLTIIGGGDLESIQKLTTQFGLESFVEIRGEVPDPTSDFQNCDAVLMCSKSEGMGRVTAEAMAFSKPVIGYNSTGTKELIKHQYNGLLYESTKDLSDAMIRLVENPQEAKKLGENGKEEFLTYYTVEKCSEFISNILYRLLNKHAV